MNGRGWQCAVIASGCIACSEAGATSTHLDASDASSSPPFDAGAASVPLDIVELDDAGTKELGASISINGGPPIRLMVDTGSIGIRVFASAVQGTNVTRTANTAATQFGGGSSAETWTGVEAYGVVQIGTAKTPQPIAFQIVTSFACVGCTPSASNDCSECIAPNFTDHGLYGNVGISLRNPNDFAPDDIYSPIAQLGHPLSDGFVVHTGGPASTQGELAFGTTGNDLAVFTQVALPAAQPASLPNGLPAWQDTQVDLCFSVNGTPLNPPCSPSIFDTGLDRAIVYGQGVPAGAIENGALAAGALFEARNDAGLDIQFTVEDPQASIDNVQFYSGGMPFSMLGAPVFYRFDVAYDIAGGHIGVRPL